MQYILEGPQITLELSRILEVRGYVARVATPNNVFGNLPKVLLPDVSVHNGRLGAQDLKAVMSMHDFVLVRTRTAGDEILAVRVFKTKNECTIHLVLGNNGRFSYVALSSEDFLQSVDEGPGTTALSRIRNLFQKLERRETSCLEFIPADQGWTELQTAQKLGWDYWWLSE